MFIRIGARFIALAHICAVTVQDHGKAGSPVVLISLTSYYTEDAARGAAGNIVRLEGEEAQAALTYFARHAEDIVQSFRRRDEDPL